MQLFRKNRSFYKVGFSKSICFCKSFKESALMPLYISWFVVAEMGSCRPANQIARHFVVFRPSSFGCTSFLMSRCTRALNGQVNFCGRGAWKMRGHGILEETPAAPFCSGAHLISGNPDAVGVDKRRWGVVQPVGHHTVNVDGEGSNPSAPANFSA
jgi:hypothetical protein